MQLLTIEELLSGKGIDYPPSEQVNVTLKKAPKAKVKKEPHPELEYPGVRDKEDSSNGIIGVRE